MTKTERQQAALDWIEQSGHWRECTSNAFLDCNDPNSYVFDRMWRWCSNCLLAELAGAKIAEPGDDLSDYKSVPGKVVGHATITYRKSEPEDES